MVSSVVRPRRFVLARHDDAPVLRVERLRVDRPLRLLARLELRRPLAMARAAVAHVTAVLRAVSPRPLESSFQLA